MKLNQFKNKKWNYLALSFAFPVIGVLFVMLFSQYEPFGDYSMLYSDMYHQYYPFFKAFRAALRSGDSLLYSWNVGMGMDYLGLISYYLASPLNLLSVLVPEGILLEFFSLLVPVKLGIAGLCFAYFLKQLFGKDDIALPMFGTMYALCAWALGYQWNIMWLDTFALLPLVVLGMVALLRDKKFCLYTVSLFLAVYSNYYVGFFVCLFVFLLFFVYQICRWQGIRRFFQDLCRIALFSVLAIGMTAFLELPALAALQTTQSSVNQFPEGFKLNIADENTWKGLLDAMRQVAGNMSGGVDLNFKEGLPNIYCGVGAIILGFLYLISGKINLRDKLCALGLLLFFNISFIVRQLDYIWHGFHFTNMIPYRFSFLYSFVMLYMAYRAWMIRDQFRFWQVLVSGVLSIGIMICGMDQVTPVFLAYNGIFLLLYIGMLCYSLTKPQDQDEDVKRIGTIALSVVMVMELVLNLINFSVNFTGTTVTAYPRGTEYTASIIRYMKEREEDTLFYRAETTHSQTLNDGALNRYNGVSTFTSSANVKVTEFMKSLGYGAKNTYNRYCWEESSPVSNLFLNLKYMISRDGNLEENPYFDNIHQYGKVTLLQNNAYLPLGFLANEELAEASYNGLSNTFTYQNKLLQYATGTEDDVWTKIDGANLSITGDGVDIKPRTSQTGYCTYTASSEGGTIIYKYTAPKDGFVCVDLNLPKKNKISFWKDGAELYNETYSIPQSLSVCQMQKGDVFEIHLTCKADEQTSMNVRSYILDEALFRECYDVLNASTLELTTFENTLVEGTIDCNRDGLLYTSIPQDGNWVATVDGKPAEIVLVGDAMVGLMLTEGTHEVSFRYENKAFALGWKVTLICTFLFVGLYVYFYRYRPAQKERLERDDTDDRAVPADTDGASDSENPETEDRFH